MVEERGEPFLLSCLAACRMRSSAWDTLARPCARRVLPGPHSPWPRPSLHRLRRRGPALFVGFPATMAGPTSACVHHRLGAWPSRCGPAAASDGQTGISRFPCRCVHACRGLMTTPGRAALAVTRQPVLPSALSTASAPRMNTFRGSMAGLCAPLPTLRRRPHGRRRMARGHRGWLGLRRNGLAPATIYRSPRRTERV